MNPSNSVSYSLVSHDAQLQVGVGLPASGEPFDLGDHRRRLGVHVQRAAVGEHRVIGRVHRQQFEAIGQRFSDRREGVVDDVGHRQHRRSGVEAVAGDVGTPDSAAGNRRRVRRR